MSDKWTGTRAYDSDDEVMAAGASSASATHAREAKDAFEQLASLHDRGVRRVTVLGLGVLFASAMVVILAIDVVRTNPAYRYASASRHKTITSEFCDRALGRRRLWFGRVVTSHALCVNHVNREETLDRDDAYPRDDFSFLVIGDWGRDGMCCQHDVAYEMSLIAKYTSPKFVATVGDNFYERGIKSLNDDQINRSWRNVYTNPFKSLNVPWHAIPGNHDYEGDVYAQVELSDADDLWHMPHSFYFDTYADGDLFIAYLDTTCMYYSESSLRSFPNGSGTTSSYCEDQTSRLEGELKRSRAKWKLVLGHHPFYASSEDSRREQEEQKRLRERLKPIFAKYGVSAYVSGHEHLMEHFVDDGFHSFVCGAGSKIRDVSLRQAKSVFSIGTQGFLQVALRNSSSVLHFRFFDLAGAVLHSAFLQPS